MKQLFTYTFLILLLSLFATCVEPYQPKTLTFEDVLVVEAVITNEMKHQEVKLSRVYRLQDSLSLGDQSAEVWITKGNETIYNFSETESGVYLSDEAFMAEPSIDYVLNIKTLDDVLFQSNVEKLTPVTTLASLYPMVVENENETGIELLVDTSEDVGEAKYFRYEYEETYKIVVPHSYFYDIEIINVNEDSTPVTFDILLPLDDGITHTCYTTNHQTDIIQANVANSTANNIMEFPIRYIASDSYLIRTRYSILVRQFVQSIESYNYYKILQDLGGVESLLSERQTGYIESNLYAVDNAERKVVGFFDVSSVSSKRIYLDYTDFNFILPKYEYECITSGELDYNDTTTMDMDPNERLLILQYLRKNPPWELKKVHSETIYELVNPECGNCTNFSSNVKPDFWED